MTATMAAPRPVYRTLKDYRIEGVKLSIDERAGFVLAHGRAEPISPRCCRFLRCIADLYKTCPKGVGSARLMRAIWGRDQVRGANLQQLARVAAEARQALRPLGFDCERFRIEGIADWPGYRIAKRGEAA